MALKTMVLSVCIFFKAIKTAIKLTNETSEIYDPKQKQNGRPADQNKETSRGNISAIKPYFA